MNCSYSFTGLQRVEGWSNPVSVQPVPKAVYRSDFYKNHRNCLQHGFNPGTSHAAGKHATQDHCELHACSVCDTQLHCSCSMWLVVLYYKYIIYYWFCLFYYCPDYLPSKPPGGTKSQMKKYGKEQDKYFLRKWSEKEGCDGLVMSREWMKYAFRSKRCTGKLWDSGEDLAGQGWLKTRTNARTATFHPLFLGQRFPRQRPHNSAEVKHRVTLRKVLSWWSSVHWVMCLPKSLRKSIPSLLMAPK